MTNQEHLNRRNFLETTGKSAAVLAAVTAGAPAVLSARAPNETLGVGCIGLGVRGGTLCRQVAGAEGADVVAVCDVYKPHVQKGVERSDNPDVKSYVDYHDLLDDPNVDAVTIATPDHWHSQILIDAANAGKDVYVEKGWTRTIPEAKAMRAAIKKTNVIMQLGHQGREKSSGLQAAQLIEDGVIGPVTLVRTGRYENRPIGQNIWRWYGWYDNYNRPDPAQVKRDLDWDRWLGPADKRPFSMEHFWHWRCYWDYGTGIAGDLLSHEIDFVQAVLRHGIPDTCTCTGFNALLKDGREVPDTWNTIYTFEEAERTVSFVCSMNTSAILQPPEFYGKEAAIAFDSIAQAVTTFDVYAEPNSQKYKKQLESGTIKRGQPFMNFDASKTPEQPYHMQDFINACHSRKKAKCDEDQAFIEAATLILSVAAYKERREVRWDHKKEEMI